MRYRNGHVIIFFMVLVALVAFIFWGLYEPGYQASYSPGVEISSDSRTIFKFNMEYPGFAEPIGKYTEFSDGNWIFTTFKREN